MENKQSIDFDHKFSDLAECTEYFYDEVGKLDYCIGNGISKKEAKRIHNAIMKLFYSSLENFERKRKVNDVVDKTELKEFSKEYKKEHDVQNRFVRVLKAVANFPKKALTTTINLFKGKKITQIELVSSEEEQLKIDNSCQQSISSEIVIEEEKNKE